MMTARRFQSSRPNEWVQPRPRSGLTREYVDGEGAIQPMDEDDRMALRIAAAASGVRRVWRWLLAALVAIGVPMLIHHVASAWERINL